MKFLFKNLLTYLCNFSQPTNELNYIGKFYKMNETTLSFIFMINLI